MFSSGAFQDIFPSISAAQDRAVQIFLLYNSQGGAYASPSPSTSSLHVQPVGGESQLYNAMSTCSTSVECRALCRVETLPVVSAPKTYRDYTSLV